MTRGLLRCISSVHLCNNQPREHVHRETANVGLSSGRVAEEDDAELIFAMVSWNTPPGARPEQARFAGGFSSELSPLANELVNHAFDQNGKPYR